MCDRMPPGDEVSPHARGSAQFSTGQVPSNVGFPARAGIGPMTVKDRYRVTSVKVV